MKQLIALLLVVILVMPVVFAEVIKSSIETTKKSVIEQKADREAQLKRIKDVNEQKKQLSKETREIRTQMNQLKRLESETSKRIKPAGKTISKQELKKTIEKTTAQQKELRSKREQMQTRFQAMTKKANARATVASRILSKFKNSGGITVKN